MYINERPRPVSQDLVLGNVRAALINFESRARLGNPDNGYSPTRDINALRHAGEMLKLPCDKAQREVFLDRMGEIVNFGAKPSDRLDESDVSATVRSARQTVIMASRRQEIDKGDFDTAINFFRNWSEYLKTKPRRI